MYLPNAYQKFSSMFPGVLDSFQKLGAGCRDAGPLDDKTQNLVKLGVAVGANSRGAVMSSVRKALSTGASEDEIYHAILLSITTSGFPAMIAAMGWAGEVLEKGESKK